MTVNSNATESHLQTLSERTRLSITQLRDINKLPLPRQRHALIAELIDNANTYLVFLEEGVKLTREGGTPEASMLANIQTHCQSVYQAWNDVKAEFDRLQR